MYLLEINDSTDVHSYGESLGPIEVGNMDKYFPLDRDRLNRERMGWISVSSKKDGPVELFNAWIKAIRLPA